MGFIEYGEYGDGPEECTPKVIGVHTEYEGLDEYSTCGIYNCQGCENKDCEYWCEYNDAEPALNPDIAEFVENFNSNLERK